jgi:hypothetical protein
MRETPAACWLGIGDLGLRLKRQIASQADRVL